jgi:tyrosyl-tRNA synthetase
VWLDSGRTSPYRFYQFWFNTADADVLRYRALFTDIPRSELDALAEGLRTKPEARAPQRTLAQTLTTLVHGAEETRRAEHARVCSSARASPA